jgi:serine/threonine protein kinase/uncharacterized protein YegL
VVMEPLDGGTLAERLAAGALPWDQAVALLLPLCQALSYAHRQGITHRDVKPANIMFNRSGTLKLADFGLARWNEEQAISQTDATRGTLAYMAPEQLGNQVDARSDTYALGIILIEAITGRNVQIRPDLGQTLAFLVSDEPVDLRPLSGIVPPRLAEIIGKMVAKQPDERYGECREACQDLETILTYATADWRSSPESAQVRLLNPHRMDLPAEAGDLLSHLFPGSHYQSVEIDLEFGKGYSGARVLLVYATRSDGSPELPAVVKMGPLAMIKAELEAYDNCIRHKLPAIARIEGEAVFPLGGQWGAVRYSLAGEGVTEVESLRSYYQHADINALLRFLEMLFDNMKKIWLHDHAEAGFRRQMSYDGLLPVNLLVKPLSPPAGADIQPIHPQSTLGSWLKPGDYVRLEGFAEEERDETTITLNFGRARDSRAPSYRLRLGELEDIDRYRVGPAITGQVLTTRSELLQNQMRQAGGGLFQLSDDGLSLSDGRRLPNPLANLPELLRQRQSVKIACIHGDLNMENVLVDAQDQVHLIDFASARPDHVLHDFLRLESAVIISLLPGSLAQEGLTADTILDLYQKLHCAAFHEHPSADIGLEHEVLNKPFRMIMAIRKMARTCFFNQADWREYYQGLVIYLLGALKYRNLDREPTAPLPKQLACLGAAVIQQMLDDPPDCGPQKFGRYQVIREIGRGGMGVVYQARDPQMERTVAVKTLPRQWVSDPQLRQHLHREAKTIANLQHPAIVPVHDFGEARGQPYLVMGYMPGGSLNDRLQSQGPLAADEALKILGRLAPALDRAHSKGIIHRDIKPANIVFDEEGEAFLADFGIARNAGTAVAATGFPAGAGLLATTTAYTSPEQVRGDARVDARSDVYAMGATLFMMLTGHPPYQAETPEALAQLHLSAPAPNLRPLRPELPQAWQQVITQALAKEPELRFASVGQMENQLRASLAPLPRPAAAPAPPEPEPLLGWFAPIAERGLPVIAWLIGIAVTIGLIALAIIYIRGLTDGPEVGQRSDEQIEIPAESTAVATAAAALLEQPPVVPMLDGTTYYLLLDTSTTMEGEKLDSAVEAIAQFVAALGSREEIVVYAFNDEVEPLLPLNRAVSVRATLEQELHALQAQGGSALYDATCQVIEAARSTLTDDEADDEMRAYKVVVLTDGPDTNSRQSESAMLTNCIAADGWPERIRLYTIGYGDEVEETILIRMANRTSGQYYPADTGDLADVLESIAGH